MLFFNTLHLIRRCGDTFSSRRRRGDRSRRQQTVKYILTYALKAVVNFIIGVSQHSQSELGKKTIPFDILLSATVKIMLRAVNFDDCFGTCTVKIHDIFLDNLLPMKGDRQFFQEFVPKPSLLLSHAFSQSSCNRCQIFVIAVVHRIAPQSASIVGFSLRRSCHGVTDEVEV